MRKTVSSFHWCEDKGKPTCSQRSRLNRFTMGGVHVVPRPSYTERGNPRVLILPFSLLALAAVRMKR